MSEDEGDVSPLEEVQEGEGANVEAPASKTVAAKTKEVLARGKAQAEAGRGKKVQGKADPSCDSDICPTHS